MAGALPFSHFSSVTLVFDMPFPLSIIFCDRKEFFSFVVKSIKKDDVEYTAVDDIIRIFDSTQDVSEGVTCELTKLFQAEIIPSLDENDEDDENGDKKYGTIVRVADGNFYEQVSYVKNPLILIRLCDDRDMFDDETCDERLFCATFFEFNDSKILRDYANFLDLLKKREIEIDTLAAVN